MRLSLSKLAYQLVLKLLMSCLGISMGAASCMEDTVLQQISWASGSYYLFASSFSMFCEP